MKKIIFRFWIINFLISIALFFIYRVVIAETKTTDGGFFETVLDILDILLNLGLSFGYLIVMVICSLAFFLNLIGNIRNNRLLSFLTFLGFPLICVIYLVINVSIDFFVYNVSLLTTLMIFSLIYLCITAMAFLMFKRRLKVYELKAYVVE
jgi:hypothetical protein